MDMKSEIAPLQIAAIVSMKAGMEAFVHRELGIISDLGHQILLLPTKVRPGLYAPRPEWTLYRWHWPELIWAQLTGLASMPRHYLGLLREALATGSVADFLLAWQLRHAAEAADVLYATFGDHKFFVGWYLKRISGRPLVVTIHAYELYKNPNPELFLIALEDADQVITVTEHNRELLRDRFRVSENKLRVVRINVDTEEFRPSHPLRILTVGSFVERKGHETLFRAIKQLDRDDLQVWVVGDRAGEDRNTVDVPALAKEIGVERQVAFFGSQKDLALKALYQACEIFCLPSRIDSDGVCEGFPTVIAEAMAFGKPVISTHHVEIPRVLPNVIVPENDPQALAEAITHLAASHTLRIQLGQQNRLIAESLFSAQNAHCTAKVLTEAALRRCPAYS